MMWSNFMHCFLFFSEFLGSLVKIDYVSENYGNHSNFISYEEVNSILLRTRIESEWNFKKCTCVASTIHK